MRLAKGHNPVKAGSQHSPNFSGHQLLQLNCGGEAPPPHEPAIFAPGIDLLTRTRIDPHPGLTPARDGGAGADHAAGRRPDGTDQRKRAAA